VAIQSDSLDPNAVSYTDDQIVDKINTASSTITRSSSVSPSARPISPGEVTSTEIGVSAVGSTELAASAIKDNLDGMGTNRGYVKTDPQTGEFPIVSIQRDSSGKLDLDYDDDVSVVWSYSGVPYPTETTSQLEALGYTAWPYDPCLLQPTDLPSPWTTNTAGFHFVENGGVDGGNGNPTSPAGSLPTSPSAGDVIVISDTGGNLSAENVSYTGTSVSPIFIVAAVGDTPTYTGIFDVGYCSSRMWIIWIKARVRNVINDVTNYITITRCGKAFIRLNNNTG